MSCQHPRLAVRLGKGVKPKFLPERPDMNLKDLRFKYGDDLLLLPCGHCLGCQIDRSKEWAVRIMLEAALYTSNCFLTLTYDEKHVGDNVLDIEDLQLFMKRLRKFLGEEKVRYFACGEFGNESGRKHYHAIIFGYDFPDKVLLKRSRSGRMIYRSESLEKLWNKGISSIGEVTPQSASYVARYCMKKKLTGKDSGEFVLMSRRPGIGRRKFNIHWFDNRKIYSALGESSIPRFYQKMLECLDPVYYDLWKEESLRVMRQVGDRRYIRGLEHEEQVINLEADLFNKNQHIERGL